MSKRQNLSAATTALCLVYSLGAQAGGLPERPQSGVDPDLRHAIEAAKENLQANKPAVAAKDVLNLYLVGDRFTKAQLPLISAESEALLRDAGKQLVGSGQVEPGLTALDGAWLASGRAPDPEYGKLLVDASARTAPYSRAEALFLARRARQVDPSNPVAEQADKHLSANRYKIPALVLLIAGGAALAAGIGMYAYAPGSTTDMGMTVDNGKTLRIVGVATAVGGGLILAGGSLLLRFGKPIPEPVSPAYLPAYLDTPQ
jgi:hypothetical protein